MGELAIWGSFLSGLGALAALIISIIQINRNSSYEEANFWLTLREMFKSEERDSVHKDLRKSKWKEIAPTDKEDWVKIEDYLGLFEVCEGMLEKKIINENLFKNLYEYRIYNLLENKELVKHKLLYEYYDWKLFYKLLARIYWKKKGQWIELYVLLSNLNLDDSYPKINKEEDFINLMTDNNRKRFLELKKDLLDN